MHSITGPLIEKSKGIKSAGLLFGLSLILMSLTKGNYLGAILGILVFFSSLLRKQHRLNGGGVSIIYIILSKEIIDTWFWEDISSLHWEKPTDKEQALHFAKGTITRRMIFYPKDFDDIRQFAKNKNQSIIMAPID